VNWPWWKYGARWAREFPIDLGDLTRQHLDIADPNIPSVDVVAVEGGEIETLRKHEHIRDNIAAATWNTERQIVTACTRVRVWGRDAVEIPWEDEWAELIRQWIAGAFGERTATALLDRPGGRKQLAALFD